MGVSIQDRTDFLNMLDACRTEQQLFSRLTFAVMFHQTDPAAREDLLDDVRGAACSMQLPAVNYKIDQWLNTCKQAWQADPAAFMAAVNADAKQRKLALEGSAAQPGLLADVPMQSVAWLVPQLLPLGEVSLLGADGGTGKKDADFIEERRVRTAETRQDTRSAILNVLSESRLGSMANPQLKSAVLQEIKCSEATYKRSYAELVRDGDIAKYQLCQKDGARGWFTRLAYRGETHDTVRNI